MFNWSLVNLSLIQATFLKGDTSWKPDGKLFNQCNNMDCFNLTDQAQLLLEALQFCGRYWFSKLALALQTIQRGTGDGNRGCIYTSFFHFTCDLPSVKYYTLNTFPLFHYLFFKEVIVLKADSASNNNQVEFV